MPSSRLLFRTRAHVHFLQRRFLLGIAAITMVGMFARVARAANHPVPFVDIVSPASINPGSTGVTLTLRGVGFVASSAVLWNGVALSTTFVNAQRLTASVPDAFVAAVGLGSVTVSSPGPGGGKSDVVYIPIASAAATVAFPSSPTSSVSVGAMPQGIVTADFNGDGNLDLAAANFTEGTVSILLGDGHGGFTTKSTPAAGAGANWLAVGDFNEDGISDLAVANNGSAGIAGVSILLGNGDGTFVLKSSPATGDGPFALTAGDFDGDGHLDLVVSNANANSVSVLLGAGDGTFTASGTLTVGALPQVIVAGDFNEDGKLDLVVANESAGTVSLLIGNGNGSFQSQAVTSTGGTHFPIGVIAADFNGDGHLDAAAVNASDVGVLLGNGGGTLTLTANPATGSFDLIAGVAGDYNGDGELDLVVSDRGSGKAFLLPGIGDGTFGPKVTFTTAAGAFGVATADFNGDGALDLAIANGNANNVSVFLQLLPVTLNPTSFTFASQGVSTSSSSQPITLTNKSGGNLNFTSIGFTGANSGEFSQTNTCGASILNNATCTINLTFTPLASGARVATLQIVDNASNSPQTLAVSGTGSASLAISSASSTAFSVGAAGTFTVTATGSPAPSLDETGALPGAVSFTDNGNGSAMIAGIPSGGSAGTYVLTITAHNGVATDVMQTFTLTVLGPPSITKLFGVASTPIGATVSLSFSIMNPNAGTALTGISFTDNLPAGLIVDSPNNLSSTCGGTATAVATSSAVSLSGGSLASSASCTVLVNVLATTLGGESNRVTVSDTSAGTGNTSVALLTVDKADTFTAVTSSANPSVFGQSVTFTATVSAVAPGTGTATGTVTFLDGGSSVGSGNLSGGQATFTTSALAPGNHTITTSYGGDASFNGSIGSLTGNPQVVNKANTATAVTSSSNPSSFGQSVTLTATISAAAPGAGTPSGVVKFFDGGVLVASVPISLGVGTFTSSTLAAGNHMFTTTYTGDGAFNVGPGLLTGNPQVVNKTDTTTAVTSSQNPSSFGQVVTFTATVSPMSPGTGAPTGTVTFLDGGSSIGSGNLSGGVATFTTSTMPLGNHTVTTTYAGSANFNGSVGTLTGNPQVVDKIATTTALSSSQNSAALHQSVVFTATVATVPAGSGTPTGTMTFLDGGSSIGSGTLSGGAATFTTAILAAGSHTIAATYNGDSTSNTSNAALTGNPQIVVAPPVAATAFAPAIITLNGVSSLAITLTNPAANTVAFNGVSITDTFPANLAVATPSGLSNTCGGAATAPAGSVAASLNGANIPVNASCTITLNVTSSASGAYANTTSATGSANGGAGNTASATLTVADPPSIMNSFGAASLGLGESTTLSFVITNPNSAIALTGVALTDNLPSGLVVATPDGLAGACGSGVITTAASSQIITLAGGAIATSSSCTFSVNVTAAVAGNQVDATGAVSSGNAGTGNTATASINVLAPDLILAKSHAGNFYQGQIAAAYNLIVSNTGAGPTLGGGHGH
ncbi:MAG: FG-GAP-like repeat-containing protein [Acidobacteriia bacterium]|nr:FG-GAP-like repeat-containing protein [Terriglobia bacterium]